MKRKHNGYIVLILALIVSGIGAAVAANMVLRSTDFTITAGSGNAKSKASSLAEACLEQALITLKNHKHYGGDETVIVDNGPDGSPNTSDDETCRILSISGTGNTNRIIQTQATVQGTTQYKEAKITQINPKLKLEYRKSRAELATDDLNTDNPWKLDSNNLTLWLKASGILQNSGAQVSSWVGQSKNTLTLDQSTQANKPTLQTNELNGRPVVKFDGDDYLTRSNTTLSTLVQSNKGSIFIVQRQDGSSDNNTTFDIKAPDDTNRLNTHLDVNDTLYFDFGDINGGGRITAGTPSGWDNTYHLVELLRDGSSGTIRVDNVTELSGSFNDSLDTSKNDTFYIGDSGKKALQGQIAEIIIYKDVLTDSEKSQVRSYLNAKYNLY